MSQPVLVGVPPGRGFKEQVALGSILAQTLDAPLHLVAVYTADPLITSRSMRRVARGEAEEELAEARAAVEGVSEVQTRSLGARTSAQGLFQAAEEADARLLVIGSTRKGRVGRIMLGDTGLNVFRAAPCAVAIPPRSKEITTIERVGVAYLDTEDGEEALRAAAQTAKGANARLEALTIVAPGEGLAERRQAAQASLDAALARLGDGVEAHGAVHEGEPLQVLTSLSAEFDALVCGSRGYGPPRRVLMGSLTQELVREAQCVLILIPHRQSGAG